MCLVFLSKTWTYRAYKISCLMFSNSISLIGREKLPIVNVPPHWGNTPPDLIILGTLLKFIIIILLLRCVFHLSYRLLLLGKKLGIARVCKYLCMSACWPHLDVLDRDLSNWKQPSHMPICLPSLSLQLMLKLTDTLLLKFPAPYTQVYLCWYFSFSLK